MMNLHRQLENYSTKPLINFLFKCRFVKHMRQVLKKISVIIRQIKNLLCIEQESSNLRGE